MAVYVAPPSGGTCVVDFFTGCLHIMNERYAAPRIIVRMANYNKATQEIARPSDLLAGIKAYTSSLYVVSKYMNIDITRLVKNVLLQQTQPLDSHGEQTITTFYTNW